MADLNVSLIMRLVDRISGPLKDVQSELQQTQNRTRHLRDAGLLAGKAVLGIGAAAVAGTGAAIAQAVTMEDVWSEANKTLGMSPQQLQGLKDDIGDLAAEIPVATQGMVEIADVAGQLGLRGREDIRAFTEDAAKMSATFDVSAQASAQMMGSWREQMNYAQDEVRGLADQINYLGNTTAADSVSIAEYTTRVLKIASDAGMAEEEILALGASMIASGHAPEVAATGLRAFLRTMTETSGQLTKSEQGILRQIGLLDDWDDIQTRFHTDSAGAIRQVVEALETLPEADQNSAISNLFGEEAARSLGGLLGDTEALERALGRVDELEFASGSMQAEFEALSDDVADTWTKLMNVVKGRSVEFGATFLGPINDGLKDTREILTTLNERITVVDRMQNAFSGFAAGAGLEAGGSFQGALAEAKESLSELLFGTVYEDGSVEGSGLMRRANDIAEMFADAESWGARARSIADEVTGGMGRIADAIGGALDGDPAALAEEVEDLFDRLASLQGPTLDLVGLLPEDLPGLHTLQTAQDLLNGVITRANETRSTILEAAGGVASSLMTGDLDGLVDEIESALTRLSDITLPEFDLVGLIPDDIPGAEALRDAAELVESLLSTVRSMAEIATGSAVAYLRGFFDGLLPYLEPLNEKLGAIWDEMGGVLAAVADFWGAIADRMGDASDSESGLAFLNRFGEGMGRFLGTMTGFSLDVITLVLRGVREFMDTMAALAGGDWEFPDFGEALDDVFDFEWHEVLPEWDWLKIIKGPPDLGKITGIKAEVDMSGPRELLRGILGSEEPVEVPARVRIDTPTAPSIADVAADAQTVEDLQRDIEEVIAAARDLPPEIRVMVAETEAVLSALDFTAHGQRIMETLATGLRSGNAAVVAAVQEMAAAVRAAMPSGPAVALAVQTGQSAQVQARAAGGWFGPGWLLTGEEGPELEYRSQGGFIAHHGQLREMLEMSDIIRRNAGRMAPVAATSPLRAAARGQAEGGTRQFGDIHIHAAPGMDSRAVAQDVMREIRRAERTGNDALHDGGFYDV
ncbi:phage tail tape measure protein [Salipiger sp. IMCC34102]|uniref:phage tail tape measure protein n=1 Tax=Salipiger sp. IMCC34102 TaxID=2510647 RepID=UPI00101D6683|nr:phage tail tape measure protein [Salipiger sp. IMCC34102]RYH02828.1 phage tail tape measure protein [Salipiger sp. IMCC34102]